MVKLIYVFQVNRLANKWKISFINRTTLFEYFIDLFSFVMVGYYIYIFMKSMDARSAREGLVFGQKTKKYYHKRACCSL